MSSKNYEIHIGDNVFHAVQFGSGEKHLVLIPGLGDGLSTLKGKAGASGVLYRRYGKKYRVTMISRKNNLSPEDTTVSLAKDQALAMQALKIEKAHVMGLSMGGMIAQHLAADYRGLVDKLVLVSTAPKADGMLLENLTRWKGFAEMGACLGLAIDMTEKAYTEKKRRVLRPLYPYMGSAIRKADLSRFSTTAEIFAGHDALSRLSQISAPALILAGREDRTVDVENAHLLHRFIEDSQLKIYENQSHVLLDQEPDFHKTVLSFLGEE